MHARAFLLGAVLALAAPAAARAQSVREVAARVHEEGGYGERLRAGPAGGGPEIVYGGGGAGRERTAPAPRPAPRPRASLPVGAGGGAISYALMGVAIVIVVAAIILLLVRLRPSQGALAPPRERRDASGDERASPLPGRAVDPSADPDLLAAEGRFAEAIAVALVRSLIAVGWRPEGLGRSRTAREILASVPDGAQRDPLGELVHIEERVAFGGDEATRERWERARAEWRRLEGAPA